MRLGHFILLAAVLLSWTGVQAARADETDDVTGLRQRLDQYEAELRSLRAQMQENDGVKAIGFTENSFADVAAEAAADANAAKPTIKKVDIVAKPAMVLTGRLFYDTVWINQSDRNVLSVGQGFDGNDFRELRLGAKGSIYENIQVQIELDFAQQGRPTFNDENSINVSDLPLVQNFKIGRFKEYFGLEQFTSSRYITFMERSAPTTAFTPGSTTGFGIWGYSENLNNTYGLGVFRPVVDQEGDSVTNNDPDTAVTGRLTHLFYYDEPSNGRYLWEVGAAASYRTPATNRSFTDGFAGFSTRPEMRMGMDSTANPPAFGGGGDIPNFVSTGTLSAVDHWELYGAESVWINGPLSIQAEGFWANVNRFGANPDLFFPGAYVQISYFLTGENRNFDRLGAKLDRVTPYTNFFRVSTCDGVCCGSGAWEVAGRYSYIDLNDENINGGRMNDFTFGVNWYLNPYTRWMFNYVHSDLEKVVPGNAAASGSSFADLYGMRFQIDF